MQIHTYKKQDVATKQLANEVKIHEEKILQCLDHLVKDPNVDQQALAHARTTMQTAYMWVIRSIFNPQRIDLEKIKEDDGA